MRAGQSELIGTLLEQRYRIDAAIARGGMSTVYRGLDVRLDRPVAIKVMDPKFAADPQFLARFEFEARAVAKLKHPGLVAVYDQGIDGEYAFLVMELIEGGTLRELLRERGPMPPHAVRAVAEPVLEALGVAHRAGLVHRDVKPENVLISESGEVKIADFGLVRAIASANTTSSSVILGTAAYLSPEQVTSGNADARSDVYSFGIMIFEMLTGRTPFVGDTSLSVAYQRINKDVPLPGELIGGVPAEFDKLVLESTARDPQRRFADAAAMAASLRAIAKALELPPYRVPAPRHLTAGDPATVKVNGVPAKTAMTQPVSATKVAPALPAAKLAMPVSAAPPAGPMPTKVETKFTRATPVPPGFPPPASPSTWRPPGLSPAPPRRGPSGGTKFLLGFAALVVLGVVVGVGGWLVGHGNAVTIPSVNGMSQTDAENALREAGFVPKPHRIYSDGLRQGLVTGTEPEGGDRRPKGSTILLDISGGRPRVPAFDPGADRSTVEQQIRDMGLQPSEGDAVYSNLPAGSVVSLAPGSGTVVPVGSTVTVAVSRGQAPAQMPDLTGRSVYDATRILATLGARVGTVTTQSGGTASDGTVVSTDPAADAGVGPGSTVNLVVSSQVRVPWVIGKTVEAATRQLRNLGLQVTVNPPTDDPDDSRVLGETPAVGALVDPGTDVTLRPWAF